MADVDSVTVIGDLTFEISSKLSTLSFEELSSDVLIYESLKQQIGGTGAKYARVAREWFRDVHLIGKVGADHFGELVLTQIENFDIRVHCSIDETSPTGLIIVLRDANQVQYRGTRLLVVNRDSANDGLTADEVSQHAPILEQSDLLILDGYCMREQPRRDACLHAMQIVHSSGGLIAFDILPHEAFKLYSLETLTSYVAMADVLIVEANTINGFLGNPLIDGKITTDNAMTAVKSLRQLFPSKTFFLFFGTDNLDETLISLPNDIVEYRHTGYEQTDFPDGWGYKITLQLLSEFAPMIRQFRTDMNLP